MQYTASGNWAVQGRGFGSLRAPTLQPGDGIRRVERGETLHGWDRYCQLVAEAYRRAPNRTPEGIRAFTALRDHIDTMFRQIQSRIDVEFVDYNPYETAQEMDVDVGRARRMRVSSLFNQPDFFGAERNLKFRAIHDYLAHLKSRPGRGDIATFDLRGELIAVNRHLALLRCGSVAAPALFTEVLGQSCFNIFYGGFPDTQKLVVLSDFDPCYLGRVRGYRIVDGDLVPDGSRSSGATPHRPASPRANNPYGIDSRAWTRVVGREPLTVSRLMLAASVDPSALDSVDLTRRPASLAEAASMRGGIVDQSLLSDLRKTLSQWALSERQTVDVRAKVRAGSYGQTKVKVVGQRSVTEQVIRGIAMWDARLAVWCACACADVVLARDSRQNAASIDAVNVARRWASGRASIDDVFALLRHDTEDYGARSMSSPRDLARSVLSFAYAAAELPPQTMLDAAMDVVVSAALLGASDDDVLGAIVRGIATFPVGSSSGLVEGSSVASAGIGFALGAAIGAGVTWAVSRRA